MRIGIVTQPLSRNYGGILQNYALQQTLIKLGHTPYTFDLGKYTWKDWGIATIKSIIKKIIGRSCFLPETPSTFYTKEHILRRFVDSHITLTTPRVHKPNKKQVSQYDLEAIIVGSDQVWRPKYNYCIDSMFLDFTQGLNVKRIAYAASFGTDRWEYSFKHTNICKLLAQKFDAISVREHSGVDLCRKYLDVEAKHVVDPTLLLTADDYKKLLTHIPVTKSKYLFAYILDQTNEKIEYVIRYAENLGLEVVIKGADTKLSDADSVENWLSNFRDAQYVITDSFHGSVFSIIFNVNFLTFTNKYRGNSRIQSLFRILNIEKCIIDQFNFDNQTPYNIDWCEINNKINDLKHKANSFLCSSLMK